MSLENCELIFQGPQGWGLYHCGDGRFCVNYPDADTPYCDSFDECLKKLVGEQKAKFLQEKSLWVMVDATGKERYFDLNGKEANAPEKEESPEQEYDDDDSLSPGL